MAHPPNSSPPPPSPSPRTPQPSQPSAPPAALSARLPQSFEPEAPSVPPSRPFRFSTAWIFPGVLTALLLAALIYNPASMIEGLPIGAAYALVAVGYSMVYGILKLINFAHSEIFMLGAFFTWSFLTPAVNYDPATHVQTLAAAQFWSTALYLAAIGYVVAYRLLPRRLGAVRFAAALPALAAGGGLGCWLSYVHVPFLLALALSMTAIGLLGIAIDTIAYKALRNARRLNLLITAIGMSIFLVNATQITFGEQSKSYANDPVTGADLLPGFMEVQTRITDPAERQSLIARGALKAERRRDFFTGAWEEKPVPPQPRISNEMKNAMSWTEALRVTHEFRLWGDNYFTPRDMALILAALVCLGLLRFVVMNTRLGMMMRACSTDLEAARLMGINVEMVIAATFFLGSAMAGLAGGLFSLPPQNLYPTMGFEMGIIAFSAAVMGGIGNLPGAALGGLILGVADNFIKGCAENFRQWLTHAAPHLSAGWVNAFDLSKWSLAFAFLVLIVTVLVRPQGLMNVKTGDRS